MVPCFARSTVRGLLIAGIANSCAGPAEHVGIRQVAAIRADVVANPVVTVDMSAVAVAVAHVVDGEGGPALTGRTESRR